MMLLKEVVQRANESAGRLAKVNRLKHFLDIVNHWISADALEELSERLCDKLSLNLCLEVLQDLLGWIALPRVLAPLYDLHVIQLRLDMIQN